MIPEMSTSGLLNSFLILIFFATSTITILAVHDYKRKTKYLNIDPGIEIVRAVRTWVMSVGVGSTILIASTILLEGYK